MKKFCFVLLFSMIVFQYGNTLFAGGPPPAPAPAPTPAPAWSPPPAPTPVVYDKFSSRRLRPVSATANYHYKSYNAKKAIDGNIETYWSNYGHPYYDHDYLEIDLGKPANIEGIQVYPRIQNNHEISYLQVHYFNGKDWVNAGKRKNNPAGGSMVRVPVKDNVIAQKLRITNFMYPGVSYTPPVYNYEIDDPSKKRNSKTAVAIYEVRVFGEFNNTAEIKVTDSGDKVSLLATAPEDECFFGVGDTRNNYKFYINDFDSSPPACNRTLKRNETYVWSLTKFGDTLFFGSGSNVPCLAVESYMEMTDSYYRPNDIVCEFTENAEGMRDWRPPTLYKYNQATDERQRLLLPKEAVELRLSTTGIRSAGYHPSGLVFLAGPNREDGINIWAFNGKTGTYISCATIDLGYSNIRQFVNGSDGNLYAGLGGAESKMAKGGAVVKWGGNLADIFSGDLTTLFDFDFVGNKMDGEVVYLSEHEGRLFVDTWPDRSKMWPNKERQTGGLWMSSPLPLKNNAQWKKLWAAGNYEPDPLVASTIGGGAMASYGGWLNWGTMQVPGSAYRLWEIAHGEPKDDFEKRYITEHVWREISIFRGKNFGTPDQKIQLLYGGTSVFPNDPPGTYRTYTTSRKATVAELIQADKEHPGNRSEWREYKNRNIHIFKSKMNLMNLKPLYGRGGFGNEWNAYTWTMAVYNNDLYVGTMDHSELTMGDGSFDYDRRYIWGGDLYKFENSNMDAIPVSQDGLGNSKNFGFRTIFQDGKDLFIGTANPFNLSDDQGGWELIKINSRPPINGRKVMQVSYASGIFKKIENKWYEQDLNNNNRFEFTETGRDEWSVYLHDSSRNVSLRLDLWLDKIFYRHANDPSQPLYDITNVSE